MLHGGFRIDDPMPTAVLLGLLRDTSQPDAKRWAALLSLGVKPEPEAFDAVRGCLQARDWQTRRFAIEAIKRHPRASEAEADLVTMLFDVDDQVRQTACKVCGELRFRSAHDGIMQLLKADNPDVRDTAADTLDRLWRDSDFDRVFQLFRNDGQRAVRIAAAKTLRQHATPRTWKQLFAVWSTDREPRHRLWSCELAAEFGESTDLHAVEPLLRDRNRNVRQAAEASVRLLRAS